MSVVLPLPPGVSGGKVTVAKAEGGKPQTVCKDNEGRDWNTMGAGGRRRSNV